MTILTLFSVLCTLYSCSDDDDAPSIKFNTVTVQLNAEAKPVFVQVESEKMKVESRKMTDESVDKKRLATFNSHRFRPARRTTFIFQLSTRSAATGWASGDEVMAEIYVVTGGSRPVSCVTLRRTAEGNWLVVADKSYTMESDSETITYHDYHLLAADTLANLNTFTVKVPAEETLERVVVGLTYAPEREVLITRDAGGTIIGAETVTRGDALTTLPEEWGATSLNPDGWTTGQACVHIRTGVAGETVKMGDEQATTNSEGDAYFYPEATEATTDDITLARDGATIPLIKSGTALTAGLEYVNTLADGLLVVDNSDITEGYTLPEGVTALYVTGTELNSNDDWENISSYLGMAMLNSEVTTLIMPEVKRIPHLAFLGCEKLVTVDLPSATRIDYAAFCECTALRNVNAPLTTLVSHFAFESCTSLTSIDLPAVTLVGISAFVYCTALKNVNVPVLVDVYRSAFGGCYALTSISLPAVTSIGIDAFSLSSALTEISFGSVLTSAGSTPFYDVDTENCTLTLNSGQKQMVWNETEEVYELGTEAVTVGTNQTWLGYTWKEIKFTE